MKADSIHCIVVTPGDDYTDAQCLPELSDQATVLSMAYKPPYLVEGLLHHEEAQLASPCPHSNLPNDPIMQISDLPTVFDEPVVSRSWPRTACYSFFCHTAPRAICQIPVMLVGACFAVLDNAPYGLLIFPKGYETLSSLGASIAILTTCCAQVVFAAFSTFPYGAGAFNVENVPFLHALSTGVVSILVAEGKSERIVSTLLFCLVIASLLTALAFWILGRFKLGGFCNYVPKHVLLGSIGGMGVFLATAGIGIASGEMWTWSIGDLSKQVEMANMERWGTTIGLEVILLIIATRLDSPFVVPCYLLSVPIGFYIVLLLLGISIDDARAAGWIFDMFENCVDSCNQSLWDLSWQDMLKNLNIFSNFSFSLVDFKTAFSQLLTIMAIVFFSVMHAPLNVPALALTAGVNADLNHELKVHGLANLVSAFIGGGQCYMTYSSSMLLKTGGLIDRWAAFSIAILSGLFVLLGTPMLLSFWPRPAAAIFAIHIGGVLVRDGLVNCYNELSTLEYLVVWAIAIVMQYEFMQGVAIGMILSFGLFVFQASRVDAIVASFSGGSLRSERSRPRWQIAVLDNTMEKRLHVVTLQGTLFFGNAQQFFESVNSILESRRELQYLLIDFSRVIDLDCSGADKLSCVVRLVISNKLTLLCTGMSKKVMERSSYWATASALGVFEIPLSSATDTSPTLFSMDMPPVSINVLETSSGASCDARKRLTGRMRKFSDVTCDVPGLQFFSDPTKAVLWCEEQILRDFKHTHQEDSARKSSVGGASN